LVTLIWIFYTGGRASICGLYNTNSKLNFKDKIINYQLSNPAKKLVFFLGQSDVEFIYYYRCIKNNKRLLYKEFMDETIQKYIEFIITNIKNPIILGINPTVIKSNKHIFNVNFRAGDNNPDNPNGSDDFTMQYENIKHFYDEFEKRFDNNMEFNKTLKDECNQKNITYIDLNNEIFDEHLNVKGIYLPINDDHHLVKNTRLTNELIRQLTPYV
jgi:hypothetical protein